MGKKDSEQSRIATVSRLLRAARAPFVEVGIGDDAAVIRAKGKLVWTIDAAVEHVHFERGLLSLDQIGYRAVQAAVSDLAAMGARPLGALSNLSLPSSFPARDFERLVSGQARAAASLACPIIGGNLSRAGEISITTTALGSAARPLVRSGARPGHELWLVGDVGLARAGLLALERKVRRSKAVVRCVRAFAEPRALLAEGLALVGKARAALDVSDGLSGDAGQLARASEVRVVLDAEALRLALAPELIQAARELGEDPLELALRGGEDYALLAAGPQRSRPKPARVIGRIEEGSGVVLVSEGRTRSLRSGFDHFA